MLASVVKKMMNWRRKSATSTKARNLIKKRKKIETSLGRKKYILTFEKNTKVEEDVNNVKYYIYVER